MILNNSQKTAVRLITNLFCTALNKLNQTERLDFILVLKDVLNFAEKEIIKNPQSKLIERIS